MGTQRQHASDRTDPRRRVGLIGAECSGKSTLATALATALPACVVGEELRNVVDTLGRTPRAAEQAGILQRQAAREEDEAATCTLPWLVADPAPLMTAIYSVEYFGDDTLLGSGLEHARRYDLIVWCAPDLPWVADGVMRDGPQRRASTEQVIDRVLRSTDPGTLPPVIRVTGDVRTRVRTVTAALGVDRPQP